MINRDYFCEKLTQIVHMGAKMCKKSFSGSFEFMIQFMTNNEDDPSLNSTLWSVARQVE